MREERGGREGGRERRGRGGREGGREGGLGGGEEGRRGRKGERGQNNQVIPLLLLYSVTAPVRWSKGRLLGTGAFGQVM